MDNIETQITLSPSLLKMFPMLQMRFWYDKENLEENVVKNIAIRCISCGKKTGLLIHN